MPEQPEYAIIILAAGNSSRLGEAKQLLQYQGRTLIRRMTEAAIEARTSAVIVVTGSNAPLIEEALHALPYHAVYNPNWQSGMASSIVEGLEKLIKLLPDIAGAIFAVSDQPFVNVDLFSALIQTALEKNSGIVASEYDHTFGTPVLFSSKYFPALLTLMGAEGAKKLVKKFADDATSVPFPLGSVDIDTQEDYQKLLRNS